MEYVAGQVREAYTAMAEERYRPAAPSDGFGHIIGPLDLEREITEYTSAWLAQEENEIRNALGYCNGAARVPFILAFEAARMLCGGTDAEPTALRLLERAVKELKKCLKS